MDFILALHTISHHCLRRKMKKKNLGISEKIVNIIRYFLTDRTMKLKIDHYYSEKQNIIFNIPQGSILKPLFLISKMIY